MILSRSDMKSVAQLKLKPRFQTRSFIASELVVEAVIKSGVEFEWTRDLLTCFTHLSRKRHLLALANKGYDAHAVCEEITSAIVQAVIPSKSHRRDPVPLDKAKCK